MMMGEGHNESTMDKTKDVNSRHVKDEYFKQLDLWVNTTNLHTRAMAFFPYYLMMSQTSAPVNTSTTTTNQPNQRQQTNTNNNNNNPNRPGPRMDWFDPARSETVIRENGGYELMVAPLWKRFLAEVIDVLILFIVKIMIVFLLIDLFDIQIGLDLDFDFKEMKFLEEDYNQLLSFTSDFLILEIITKIVACLYESFFTCSAIQATPGKLIMRLRIIHADGMIPLEPQINHGGIRALIFPASSITFKRALFRSIGKNLLITLMFPMYFIMFFFRSNQLIYDLVAKTVVVEYSRIQPVLQRRQ